MKKSTKEIRVSNASVGEEASKALTYKSGPEGKILQMYALIDEAMKLKGGRKHNKFSKRVQAADKLKIFIQELVSENIDLKQCVASSSNNNSGMKGFNNAGSMIDNFGSSDLMSSAEKKHIQALFIGRSESPSNDVDHTTLQTKIWSLESEVTLLNEKLSQTITANERKARNFDSVNY